MPSLRSNNSRISSLRSDFGQPDFVAQDAPGDGEEDGTHENLRWEVQSPQAALDELRAAFKETKRFRAQRRLDGAIKDLHDTFLDRWQAELDTLLVYAGLFSAVLTAFNVESYKLLRPDNADSTAIAIRELSAILRGSSTRQIVALGSHEANVPVIMAETVKPGPQNFVIWVNCLWFSSLVLSLASASIALLVKQWLHESNAGISGQSRASTQLLQYRMDSLKQWRVREIMILVPVLLQLALFLFLIGLVVLLWNLHPTVAVVCTVFTGVFMLSFLMVNALPLYRPDCCYRSPQTLIIYRIVRAFHSRIQSLLQQWIKLCTSHRYKATESSHTDALWSILLRCGAVASKSLRNYPTWKSQERHDLRERSVELNVETAITAYRTTLDPACLDCMHIALSSEPGAPLARCIAELNVNLADGTVAAPTSLKPNILKRLSHMLLTALRQMLTIDADGRKESWEPSVQSLLSLYTGITSRLNIPPTELALRTVFCISMSTVSTENRYASLSYLATVVDNGALVPLPVTLRLLHAAEQWIGKHAPLQRGRADRDIAAAPEVSMVAFRIVARCIDRVVRHQIQFPEEHALEPFPQLCEGARKALSRIPDFLPSGEMLLEGTGNEAENERLCNQLSFGLKLLLDALIKLLQSVLRLPAAVDRPGALLVDPAVVDSLLYVWGTARTVLGRPDVDHAQGLPQGTVERLEALQEDIDGLFPQAYGLAL